jgi:colanic acid/amylovoran biosynthesis glycosyltransferase
MLFAHAALFLAEGKAGRTKLIQMGCPEQKVKVAHLGVEVARIPYYERAKRRMELNLVQVATFNEKKGHDITIKAFIKALHTCPHMTLTLVGKDSSGMRATLQSLVAGQELNHKIQFIDGIEYSNLYVFLKDYHVFIHPSKYGKHRDSEGGAPIVLLDAQATGMPVLSTFHCDIPDEVLNGETGLLVKEDNADDLADAIRHFYDMDGPDYHAYCRNARRHIEEHYHAVQCASELKRAYEMLLNRNLDEEKAQKG